MKTRWYHRERIVARILLAVATLTTVAFLSGCPLRWPIVIVKGGSGAGDG